MHKIETILSVAYDTKKGGIGGVRRGRRLHRDSWIK